MECKLYNGDCLEIMDKLIQQGIVIDAIITDPPYGTTACSWDSIIPFDEMWERLNKLIKPNGAIVLFGSEPFSSALRMSNINNYKYDWIWNKKLAGNAINAKIHPLKIHEIISVFNSKIYIPQKTKGKMRKKMGFTNQPKHIGKVDEAKETMNDLYYPKSIQDFTMANLRCNRLHPTQKPITLMEYLIRTYTNENETVLDFTMGSGSTGVAARNCKRKFIGIEKDEKYYNIAQMRINKVLTAPERITDENGFYQSTIFDFIK